MTCFSAAGCTSSARMSWHACELGFRGSLNDCERLLGAVPKR